MPVLPQSSSVDARTKDVRCDDISTGSTSGASGCLEPNPVTEREISLQSTQASINDSPSSGSGQKPRVDKLRDMVFDSHLLNLLEMIDLETMYSLTKTSKTLKDRIYHKVCSTSSTALSHITCLFPLAHMGNEKREPLTHQKPRRTPAELQMGNGMSHRVPVVLSRLQGVDKLSITFPVGSVPDKMIRDVARAFESRSLKSLRVLRLDMCGCHLTLDSWDRITSAIGSLVGLENLVWNLSESNHCRNSIEMMKGNFVGLKHLKEYAREKKIKLTKNKKPKTKSQLLKDIQIYTCKIN